MIASTTLEQLQRISDRFHELADAVLRHTYPELRSLRAYGINAEGKPTKGTPDSYVGTSPKECSIAIEHTTYSPERLEGKFLDDYDKVVRECKSFQHVVLCTNRPKDADVANKLVQRAKADGKELSIVWGEDIARTLDDHRQDLRKAFLGIPEVDPIVRTTIRGREESPLCQFIDTDFGMRMQGAREGAAAPDVPAVLLA